ncbi:hypothetical protein CEXT_367261 [Caerostris extrusa]|uniref:Uncharacterized protein n=1 Tax=Caerostris extrusa TaxID=172846 RepID=A0AAV4X705_CAEEX|nr:hypothetical protein CEXT_367261 [Caerostris extrusa]
MTIVDRDRLIAKDKRQGHEWGHDLYCSLFCRLTFVLYHGFYYVCYRDSRPSYLCLERIADKVKTCQQHREIQQDPDEWCKAGARRGRVV